MNDYQKEPGPINRQVAFAVGCVIVVIVVLALIFDWAVSRWPTP